MTDINHLYLKLIEDLEKVEQTIKMLIELEDDATAKAFSVALYNVQYCLTELKSGTL